MVFISSPVSPGGYISYSEIKSFLDIKPATVVMFKSITTSGNKTINLSGKHLIYEKESWTGKFNPLYVVPNLKSY